MDLLALAKAHIEAENHQDVDATMATVAPGGAFYDIHASGQTTHSRDAIRELYADAFQAIPDMHIDLKNAVVDETKRQVVIQYAVTGTNRGSLQGLAPTNKPVRYNGAILYAFDEAGKLIEENVYFDKCEILISMGLIKDPNTTLGLFLMLGLQSPIFLIKTMFYRLFHKKK
ncbi:MAG: hypothetical protein QOK37_4752 [Thermoanaerobaculia bacterium]|jgi:steroid delta-isomerase-like uncharacterized protein|nr:hypothetical protein [Thermoanaerobaculia bacterium]